MIFRKEKLMCFGRKGGVKETKFREWYELRKWQKKIMVGVSYLDKSVAKQVQLSQ